VPTDSPRCPTCNRPVAGAPDAPPFPFCSPRCKLADLGNWLDARYVVKSPMPFDEGDERDGDRGPVTGE
jgi:endogenous inhibitor of DNA gyrase (YacG/DUF329 family)